MSFQMIVLVFVNWLGHCRRNPSPAGGTCYSSDPLPDQKQQPGQNPQLFSPPPSWNRSSRGKKKRINHTHTQKQQHSVKPIENQFISNMIINAAYFVLFFDTCQQTQDQNGGRCIVHRVIDWLVLLGPVRSSARTQTQRRIGQRWRCSSQDPDRKRKTKLNKT